MVLAAALALGGGVVAWSTHAWSRFENETLSVRFAVRGARPPDDVAVVGIDDRTFDQLGIQWPFPRRLHARVIDVLRADGARAIAYDVQFTEPTDPRDDDALFNAVGHARNVVLATTEVDHAGRPNVLGGPANLRSAHAVAATANLDTDSSNVILRYPDRMLGLESFAAATARVAGHPVSAARFAHDRALIDFRGPPGTFPTYSFSDVLEGRIAPSAFAGKVVIVGASSATLQDLHLTSTTGGTPMSGAEVQANAIWTALHDNPLSPAPGWMCLLAVLACGLAAPLASLRFRVVASGLVSAIAALAFLVTAQIAFDSGTAMAITYPLFAALLGTAGMVAANYFATYAERNAFLRQLAGSQLELIQRLAQAVESRDAETAEHTYRISLLCRRLALGLGWDEAEAERLMYASIAHDIGKIGISDSILLKEGPLTSEEWNQMTTHTTIGSSLLAGSQSPLIQMAQTIALTHHERWDGSGYPAGLQGEEIPLPGRICAVVDVYDALLSKRRYKEAWEMGDVLAEIRRGSGYHFDPQIVDAFLALVPQLTGELHASLERDQPAPALRALPV